MKICPMCGSERLTEKKEKQSFQYNVGKDAVMINVVVPVIKCHSCGFSFTDCRAEKIRDDATLPYRQRDLKNQKERNTQ